MTRNYVLIILLATSIVLSSVFAPKAHEHFYGYNVLGGGGIKWENAAQCSDRAIGFQEDTTGRYWGWQDNASCAYFQFSGANKSPPQPQTAEVLDDQGNPPLIKASFAGDAKKVRELIAQGADVTVKNKYAKTALHAAPLGKCPDCLRALLDAGGKAIINEVDVAKFTPLHNAALNACVECINILLEAGAKASINLRNYENKTPVSLALSGRCDECAQILRAAGGKE